MGGSGAGNGNKLNSFRGGPVKATANIIETMPTQQSHQFNDDVNKINI
jgi:hypothetical protein